MSALPHNPVLPMDNEEYCYNIIIELSRVCLLSGYRLIVKHYEQTTINGIRGIFTFKLVNAASGENVGNSWIHYEYNFNVLPNYNGRPPAYNENKIEPIDASRRTTFGYDELANAFKGTKLFTKSNESTIENSQYLKRYYNVIGSYTLPRYIINMYLTLVHKIFDKSIVLNELTYNLHIHDPLPLILKHYSFLNEYFSKRHGLGILSRSTNLNEDLEMFKKELYWAKIHNPIAFLPP